MGRIKLKDGREIVLDERQREQFTLLIFHVPWDKKIKVGGEIFTLDDVDISKTQKMIKAVEGPDKPLPGQTNLLDI